MKTIEQLFKELIELQKETTYVSWVHTYTLRTGVHKINLINGYRAFYHADLREVLQQAVDHINANRVEQTGFPKYYLK